MNNGSANIGNSDSKDTFSFGVSKSGEEVILQPPTGASTILNVPAWDGTANAGMSYQRCGTECPSLFLFVEAEAIQFCKATSSSVEFLVQWDLTD